MHAIQTNIFQPGLTITEQNELKNKNEIQNFVLSKIYSFLKSEDRKVAGAVCKDWQLILHPQIGCVRLLELVKEYCYRYAPDYLEYEGLIAELEAGLLRGDKEISDKIFKDKWYLFAKKCSEEVHSVVWISRLFQDHHFSKLYNCIDLLEQIVGKNVLAISKSRLSDSRKHQLQEELIGDLLAEGHLLAAFDIFVEMEKPSEKLGKNLIRLCKINQEYGAAIRAAKKVGDLHQVMNDAIYDLMRYGKYDLALDLIQENDQKVNAARMMLILCNNIASHTHVIHRVSNETAGAIIDRMENISFDCTKNENGFRDSREDLMVFLVKELLKRDMSDKAMEVYRLLGLYDYLSNSKKETLRKIEQYCLKKGIPFSDPGL